MHAFDIMAEAKMRQWEQDVREGKVQRATESKPLALDPSESLEKRLYRDIRATVIQAYMQTGTERKQMLAEAEKMQVQLNSRMEKSGYHRISRMFSENIQTLKRQAEAALTREQLASMLDSLD